MRIDFHCSSKAVFASFVFLHVLIYHSYHYSILVGVQTIRITNRPVRTVKMRISGWHGSSYVVRVFKPDGDKNRIRQTRTEHVYFYDPPSIHHSTLFKQENYRLKCVE